MLPNDLFSPLGGQNAHTRKKNKKDAKKLGNIRKVSKPHKMIAQRPAPPPPHQNHPIKVAICNNCPLLQ